MSHGSHKTLRKYSPRIGEKFQTPERRVTQSKLLQAQKLGKFSRVVSAIASGMKLHLVSERTLYPILVAVGITSDFTLLLNLTVLNYIYRMHICFFTVPFRNVIK